MFDERPGGEDIPVLKIPKRLKDEVKPYLILEGRDERTAVYREERNVLGSSRQTNLPSSQPKPSHYPASLLPKDEVRPR